MHQVEITEALKRLRPQPIILVNTYTASGRANTMPTGWGSLVAGKPFSYAVALAHGRLTLECVEAKGAFVVSFPAPDHEDAVMFCGTQSGRDADKERESGFTFQHGDRVDAPLIVGAPVNLECQLSAAYDVGDHRLCIGEILAAHVTDLRSPLFNFGPDGFAPAVPG